MLQRLEQLPFDGSCDWDMPLSVWRYYREIVMSKSKEQRTQPDTQTPTSLTKPVDSHTEGEPSDSSEGACSSDPSITVNHPPINEKPVTFRVTCTRGGRKHSFSSMDAARCFGAGLARRFSWAVQLKNSDLEVLLTIVGDGMTVAIALNKESKYKRNITHFGPTTLRSTIAYGLLRLVRTVVS